MNTTNKKILILKTLIVVGVGIMAVVFFVVFFNQYLRKSKAAEDLVDIIASTTSVSLAANETSTVTYNITPKAAGNKISAFDINFVTSSNFQIISFGNPMPIGGINTVLTKIIADTTAHRLVYVVNQPTENLPLRISIPITVRSTNGATGSMEIKPSSQVVGYANVSIQYGFGQVDKVVNNGGSAKPTITPGGPTAPPIPTPITPIDSADIVFRAIFPNTAPEVNEIPNVKITILGGQGDHFCDDQNDCAKVVTFHRVQNGRVSNTFQSPQLQYPFKNNQAYTVVVKQNHTLQQTYKFVYLKWQKVLQCLEGTKDSGCGQLIEDVVSRPLYSGDLDGSNVIDQKDADMVSIAIGSKSIEGDLNFDGVTDQKDVEILGKNFNKKGT